jgi:flagellar hook-length control protein FliK
VLESRRYLGIAANSNSQAVAAAVTGSTEWARAMQPSSGLSSPEAASAAGKVVNTLKIQMHPIDLGTVTATLRLKDDELHVDLKVESGEAFRQLSDDQNAMVKALRAQGFAVDQINITFNAPSDTSAGNAGSQAGQQGRDASGDGAAQGRGRNDNSSQQQSGERWTGNDVTDEASAVAERGRADHTYM